MSEFTEEQIKEANEEIEKLVQQAYSAINSAEEIANKYGLEFSFWIKEKTQESDDDWISSSDWDSSDET
jgi:hypothetical protein